MPPNPPVGAPAARRSSWIGSLQGRLTLLFSLVFALTLVAVDLIDFLGVPPLDYHGRVQNLRDEAAESLSLIADLKAERLRSSIDERRKDLQVMVADETRIETVKTLRDAIAEASQRGLQGDRLRSEVQTRPGYQVMVNRFREICALFKEYDRIFLVHPQSGKVIVSTRVSDLGADVRNQPYFTRPLQAKVDYIGDVVITEKTRRPVFHISHAVCTAEDGCLAIMVVEIASDAAFRPILHTGEGLGEDGEALLVNQKGWNLTSLKHPLSDGREPKPLEFQNQAEPARRAARGEEGIVEADDYRGVPVLAACRHIQVTPEISWGLVVKRDWAEVFAPLRGDILDSILLGLLGWLVLVALVLMIARTVTRPIRDLSRAAQQIAEGDLAVRAPVITADEVGSLAMAFNAMVERIENWHRDLETEVKSRTAVLNELNERLRQEVEERQQAQKELAEHRDHLKELVQERTQELEAAHSALLRQERLATLGQLTATVSHELRNPLGTIRTSFFLVQQRVRDKDLGIEKSLDRIERAIVRCDAIIADLLDFSRNRVATLEITEIDAWLATLVEEQDIPAAISVHQELSAGARVPLDRERFRRCLVNVITNACHAMQPQGGHLTIGSRRDGQRVEIRVCDTGCGIPADQLEKVFEPLYSTKSFGVGLGLPIVQQIVHQHGGSVTIDSRMGSGTVVTLTLPLPACEETTS